MSLKKIFLFVLFNFFSVTAFSGWEKPTSLNNKNRKLASPTQYSRAVYSGGWKYEENESQKFSNAKEILELLSSRTEDFADPFCLKNTLLNYELFQAYLAIGSKITSIEAESIIEVTQGKGVVFRVYFDKMMTGLFPSTFCKMK